MNKRWPIKTLDDVCEVQLGKTPHRKTERYWDREKTSSNVWLSIADLTHGEVITDSKEYITSDAAKLLKPTPKGSLLLSFKLTLGRVAYAGRDLYTNEAIASLLSLSKSIRPQFLYYYFTYYDWNKATEGDEKIKGRTLNKTKLKKLKIPIPPLPEQDEIVSALDKACAAIDEARANIEQNITNAKELFQSKLNQMITRSGDGWRSSKVNELSDSDRGITYGVIKLGDHVPDGVPCLRTSNVKPLSIDTSGMKFIGPSLSNEYKRTVLRGGEVLVNVRGTLGGVVKVPTEMAGWNISREVAMVPCLGDKINPDYLAYSIASKRSQDWLSGVKKGAAYTGINLEDLRNLPVSYPAPDEQVLIVEMLDSLNARTRELISQYECKIDALASLKRAILQKAFAGHLVTNCVV